MADVFFSELFTDEDVAQVAATMCAGDFGATTVGIRSVLNCAREFVIEGGPAAAGAEFAVGRIKRRFTLAAHINTVFKKVVVLASEGHFGAFVNNHAGFFGGEGFGHKKVYRASIIIYSCVMNHAETGWKKFAPMMILGFIGLFTLGMQLVHGWSVGNALLDLMAAGFFIFGLFKVLRLRAFVETYSGRGRIYAYAFPFLQLALGLAYFLRWELNLINGGALVLMAVNTLGILIAVGRNRKMAGMEVPLLETVLLLAMAIYTAYILGQPSTYSVSYTMDSVEGTTVDMTLTIKDELRETVKDFETVHEKPLHLVGVRTDLHEFLHVHPEMGSNGVWEVEIEFPTEGPYQFYADFTPTDGEPQVLTYTVSIGGFVREKLSGYEATQEIEGYIVTTHFPEDVPTGEVAYSLTVEKDGQPFTAFEDYLGAKGHSVVIHEDSFDYEHVHPTSDETPSFTAHFPKGGRYAIFTQIQLEGKVLTVPYLVYVEEGEGVEHHGH